ncbi:hypothetical protein D3C78_1425410 [compost metagenome]
MVAALQETGAGQRQVRHRLFQRHARGVVAERDGDGGLVLVEVAFVVAVGVQVEIVDGIFLPFGPQALAADVGTHRGLDLQADAAQCRQQQGNGNEWPDQAGQLRGIAIAVLCHALAHPGKWRTALSLPAVVQVRPCRAVLSRVLRWPVAAAPARQLLFC